MKHCSRETKIPSYHLLPFDLVHTQQLQDIIQEALGAHEEKPAMGYFTVSLLIFMQTMFILLPYSQLRLQNLFLDVLHAFKEEYSGV